MAYQASLIARAMGSEGDVLSLDEQLEQEREALHRALTHGPEDITEEERILRTALGLREF